MNNSNENAESSAFVDAEGNAIDPRFNILFKTKITINSPEFDSFSLYIKFPQSTRHQQVKFVSGDHTLITRYSQRFSAVYQYTFTKEDFVQSANQELNTIVNIQPRSFDFPVPKTQFPLPADIFNDNESVLEFVQTDPKFPINASGLESRSRELVSYANHLWSATKNIVTWVNQTLEYDNSADSNNIYRTLSQITTDRKGSCADFVHLSLAMLRLVGIPARAVNGLVGHPRESQSTYWESHSWIEIFDPVYNWIPIDPTRKPPLFAQLTPHHIKFFTAINCAVPYYVIQLKGVDKDIKDQIGISHDLFLDGTKISLEFLK